MINTFTAEWMKYSAHFYAVLRIVSAIMFMLAGASKLFAFPVGMPPDGSTAKFFSQVWLGGVMEFFGGAFILFGFLTRPVAFILSGEMAVAYWQFHAKNAVWPTVNGGVSAVLYCFLFLYISAHGSGIWSLDSLRNKG